MLIAPDRSLNADSERSRRRWTPAAFISDHPPLMNVQDRSDWLTIDEAAARLGVSRATVQRRIQDGKPVKLTGGRSVALETEMIERPQGHEWRVRIIGVLPPISSNHEHTDSDEPPAVRSDQERSDIVSGLLDRLSEQAAVILSKDLEIARINAEARQLAERTGRAESDATHERERREHVERDLAAEIEGRKAAEAEITRLLNVELARIRDRSFWDWLRGR